MPGIVVNLLWMDFLRYIQRPSFDAMDLGEFLSTQKNYNNADVANIIAAWQDCGIILKSSLPNSGFVRYIPADVMDIAKIRLNERAKPPRL